MVKTARENITFKFLKFLFNEFGFLKVVLKCNDMKHFETSYNLYMEERRGLSSFD